MNIKIITGIFTVVLLAGGLWYITSDQGVTTEAAHEVAEHDDALASYEVSPAAVVKRVQANEGTILLDVRTPEEYKALHLENALLLPVQELSAETLSDIGLGEDAKDKEIVLYCRSGARSKTAYDIMTSLGYTNIVSVAGGMVHWEEDRYPLTETGAYTGPIHGSDVATQAVEKIGPELSVDRQLHDFGVIPQFGGKVETTFELTNTGTELLEVGIITTSCSCTAASVADASLEPNESTTMTVVFDPDLHEEPLDVFKRTIFVPTNDPKQPETEVVIQVDIAEGQ
jgi:rhodanese-related sulfurtransferase